MDSFGWIQILKDLIDTGMRDMRERDRVHNNGPTRANRDRGEGRALRRLLSSRVSSIDLSDSN
jgi:hypothetical protein